MDRDIGQNTIDDHLDDPVDKTYSDAVNFVEGLKPKAEEELKAYLEQMKNAHHQSMSKIRNDNRDDEFDRESSSSDYEKQLRQQKAMDEADRRPDQVYVLDWLND